MKRKRSPASSRSSTALMLSFACMTVFSMHLTANATEYAYLRYQDNSETNREVFRKLKSGLQKKESRTECCMSDMKEKAYGCKSQSTGPIELEKENFSDCQYMKVTIEQLPNEREMQIDKSSSNTLEQLNTDGFARKNGKSIRTCQDLSGSLDPSNGVSSDILAENCLPGESAISGYHSARQSSSNFFQDERNQSTARFTSTNERLFIRDQLAAGGYPIKTNDTLSAHSGFDEKTTAPRRVFATSADQAGHNLSPETVSAAPSRISSSPRNIASPLVTSNTGLKLAERNIVFAGSSNASTTTTMNSIPGSNSSETTYSLDIPNDNGKELNYLYLIFLILGLIIIAFLLRRYIVKKRRIRMQKRTSMLRAGALRMDLERARGSSTRLFRNSRRQMTEVDGTYDAENDLCMPPPSYPEAAHLKDHHLPVYHEVSGERSDIVSRPARPGALSDESSE